MGQAKKKPLIFCQHGRRDGHCDACRQYDQAAAAAASELQPQLGPVHVSLCRRGSCAWVGQKHGHVGSCLVFIDEQQQLLRAADLVPAVQLAGKLLGKKIQRGPASLIAGAAAFLIRGK